jgi:flagellar hook-basal body complex protein FliE
MNPMMAAKAYAAVQGGAMPTAAQAPGVGDGGFADLVKNAMTDMTQQSRAAETQMTQLDSGPGQSDRRRHRPELGRGVVGDRDPSVRDQVISAYAEGPGFIMAMPI